MPGIDVKPVKALVLDAGPIIHNSPSVSTLIQKAHRLVTLPSVVAEIRDESTRHRVEVTLKPFLEVRDPRPESIKIVADFARRTGDYAVLSGTDLRVAALAHDLECEYNGPQWQTQRASGTEKRADTSTNSSTSVPNASSQPQPKAPDAPSSAPPTSLRNPTISYSAAATTRARSNEAPSHSAAPEDTVKPGASTTESEPQTQPSTQDAPADQLADLCLNEESARQEPAESSKLPDTGPAPLSEDKAQGAEDDAGEQEEPDEEEDDEDDGGGWITPSNLNKQIAQEKTPQATTELSTSNPLDVATLTTDFALQNVLLRMHLHILSSTNMHRIRHLRTTILRCYGCFNLVKDTSKQFCPRCGQPNLTRVSATTDSSGKLQVHLKKNWQWNHRGERYSIPKPATATASGRNIKGGGKSGWGNDLILAEDQKEYTRAVGKARRKKEKDLMDEDTLPAMISGDRNYGDAGRPKVGAGKNVNAKRRSKR